MHIGLRKCPKGPTRDSAHIQPMISAKRACPWVEMLSHKAKFPMIRPIRSETVDVRPHSGLLLCGDPARNAYFRFPSVGCAHPWERQKTITIARLDYTSFDDGFLTIQASPFEFSP